MKNKSEDLGQRKSLRLKQCFFYTSTFYPLLLGTPVISRTSKHLAQKKLQDRNAQNLSEFCQVAEVDYVTSLEHFMDLVSRFSEASHRRNDGTVASEQTAVGPDRFQIYAVL